MTTDIEIQIEGRGGKVQKGNKLAIEGSDLIDYKTVPDSECTDIQVCQTKLLFLEPRGILSPSPTTWQSKRPGKCVLLKGHGSGFFRIVYFLS